MAIQISVHFTLGRLARFTAPTCAMMLFTSIYGVIDGLFVSNFVGKESFAALNLVYPLFMMLGALGYMFGTGGTALVAKTAMTSAPAGCSRLSCTRPSSLASRAGSWCSWP